MYYVYILLLQNRKLYKGVTSNLKRRFFEHQQGKVTSTKKFRPVKLIYYEAYLLKSDATRRESFLKTSDGRKFLRRQISQVLRKFGLYDGFGGG